VTAFATGRLETPLVIELTAATLLPPVCPLCGKLGVIPHSIPALEGEADVTVHYCELCHASERRRDTFLFSLSMAVAIVLAAAVGVSISVLREQWTEWLPLGVAVGAGTTIAGFVIAERRMLRRPALGQGARGQRLLILPQGPGARALLAERGALRSHERPLRSTTHRRGTFWLALAPLAGMALPVLVTHLRLRARVIVVDPHEDDLLLVDDRIVERLPALRHEWPSGGLTVHLIAGGRHLEVVAVDGATRLDERVYLDPGGTYLFGHLPEGLCLFREEQQYGETADRNLFEVQGGPLYSLQSDIQYYFEAPPKPETAKGQGGTAVALRLLPCPHRRAKPHPSP
jgi:hypothetical protein